LVYRPSLLLMDEPLGALDRKLREEMQTELKSIQRELAVTTLYVTHDQQEALALSDRVAIMHAGELVQIGSPVELYDRPAADFVASFLGDVNFVEGTTAQWNEGLAAVDLEVGFTVAADAPRPLAPGKRVRLAIRPERLHLALPGADDDGAWRVVVRDVIFHGEVLRYVVETGRGCRLKVTQPYRGQGTILTAGQSGHLRASPRDWRVFE
jgi:ABC-type Fe3+/spermidine/putrescine transport system ATPase subunit